MQITFAKRRMQKSCEEFASLRKEHGAGCAKRISARLAELAAAKSSEEFRHLPGGCHELNRERAGQLALKLPDGKRLIFKPAEDPPPTTDDGALEWGAVETIEILEIVDYH